MIKEEIKKVQSKEEEKIKKQLDPAAFKIFLDARGAEFTSEEFARRINKLGREGFSKLSFVIGGTLGFSNEFRKEGNSIISFSKMTFPHQLMRLLFLEQLYRAFKIIRDEPYHY